MEGITNQLIEEIIRKVISERIFAQAEFEKYTDPSGIISIKTSTVKPEKFDTGKAGDRVLLKDIVTLEESPRLGIGIMEMVESSFAWTLKYDEVDYVIDGTLEIDIDGRRVTGNKGDIIFIPKNSSIHFTVPNFARFMYVTYPANWAEQ